MTELTIADVEDFKKDNLDLYKKHKAILVEIFNHTQASCDKKIKELREQAYTPIEKLVSELNNDWFNEDLIFGVNPNGKGLDIRVKDETIPVYTMLGSSLFGTIHKHKFRIHYIGTNSTDKVMNLYLKEI